MTGYKRPYTLGLKPSEQFNVKTELLSFRIQYGGRFSFFYLVYVISSLESVRQIFI